MSFSSQSNVCYHKNFPKTQTVLDLERNKYIRLKFCSVSSSLKGGKREIWEPASLPRASSQGQHIAQHSVCESEDKVGLCTRGGIPQEAVLGRLPRTCALLPGLSAVVVLFRSWQLMPPLP